MSMLRRGKTRSDLLARVADRVEQTARQTAGPWYTIRNARGTNNEPATLDIYGEIGYFGVTAAEFNDDLRGITASEVEMRVNSPGGDVFDAMAIYNLIRSHPAYFTARVDGLAASAASVIIQAADRRVMMPHSQLMIHKAWAMTVGNADDHADTVELLNRQDEIIASVYHERIKGGARKLAKIKELMAAETWMSDDEAVRLGFADTVERSSWQSEPGNADDEGDDPPADDPPADDAADQPPEPDAAASTDDDGADDVFAMIRRQWEASTLDDMEIPA